MLYLIEGILSSFRVFGQKKYMLFWAHFEAVFQKVIESGYPLR